MVKLCRGDFVLMRGKELLEVPLRQSHDSGLRCCLIIFCNNYSALQ